VPPTHALNEVVPQTVDLDCISESPTRVVDLVQQFVRCHKAKTITPKAKA